MAIGQSRTLLVVADDFGIGPPTTAGILHLAKQGVVTASVMLVNSPYAADAVASWRRAGRPMDLGWHPNLTLDRPIAPSAQVPSLVDADGQFWPLPRFLRRWLLGHMDPRDIETEFRAQLDRYRELVGQQPALVNAHQHIVLFPPLGSIILDVLAGQSCFPYIRRVREPWRLLARVHGARIKRLLLSTLGRRQSRRQAQRGFPGNDWLAGVTDPPWVRDAQFHQRWFTHVPGRVVELVCHPGYEDQTLLGRDCIAGDGLMQWRVDELGLLEQPDFLAAAAGAGFELLSPTQWLTKEHAHAPAA
jgi:chitin disaccharide deacetylase